MCAVLQGMDFDGDDTMVGAEELQLLQQMSQQMIQVCSITG
jgi:hypothetical protein